MSTVYGQKHRLLIASLGAGIIAILINTALLAIADASGLVTARGGLLTLLNQTFHLPGNALTKNWAFHQGFHVFVGIGMALFYLLIVGNPKSLTVPKSLLYALLVWLANSIVVLPLIGQGFAGSRVLSPAGMLYFAFAHTAFFVINGLLLSSFASRPPRSRRPFSMH